MEEYEPEVEEYDSMETFQAQSQAVIAVPDEALLGREFANERIHVGAKSLYCFQMRICTFL